MVFPTRPPILESFLSTYIKSCRGTLFFSKTPAVAPFLATALASALLVP